MAHSERKNLAPIKPPPHQISATAETRAYPAASTNSKDIPLQILMTEEARDYIKDRGRPIALDYLAAIG